MQGQRIAESTSVPAPITGWNARDAVDMMLPTDAITLDNFYPDESEVLLRKGHTSHATGLDATTQSLMSWDGGASAKMFAATTAGSVFEVTSSGAVGSADITSLSNGQFQWVNFGTAGGDFLWMCNGADAPRHYNGTTWATPSLTGVTAADVVNVWSHKERLFFIFNDSLTFGYLGVNAVAGSVSEFNLSSLFDKGGKLMAGGTWTRDGGSGSDDLAVFITSEGEVAVYEGTNPASATTWSLVGVFRIARPIGRRCLIKAGADLIVITESGFLPLSQVLPLGLSAPETTISDKISGAVKSAAASQKATFGWQPILYPQGGYGLFNVPISTVGNFHQYVVNLTTGAWCRFTGMDASCWLVHQGVLYFGGATTVEQADTGLSDNGASIQGSGKTAFQYFGGRGVFKNFQLVRPVMSSDGDLPVSIGFDTDFKDGTDVYTPSSVDSGGAEWDVAEWDEAEWASPTTPVQAWRSVSGAGYNAALRVRTSTTAQSVKWHAWDITWTTGAGL